MHLLIRKSRDNRACNATTRGELIASLVLVILVAGLAVGMVWWTRPPQSSFLTVSLMAHTNGTLDGCWVPGGEPDNHLQGFPRGRHLFQSVPFEVLGVVQLQGQAWKNAGQVFPERVAGLRIGKACSQIHLLHANSAFADLPGTPLASLVLHYAGGAQEQIEIRQGEHILDWWAWKEDRPTDPNSTVAWEGSNPAAAKRKIGVRIIKTTFANPRPREKVETLDYVSRMAKSAPFLLAVTAQSGGTPSSGPMATGKGAATARSTTFMPPPMLYRIQQNGRVGFMNREGTVVIPPTLDPFTEDFSEGLARTPASDGAGYDLLDPTGKRTVLDLQYRGCSDFIEGVSMFGGRYCGFMDKQGRVVTFPEFRLCQDFSEGRAAFQTQDDKAGWVDKTGKPWLTGVYQVTDNFSGGLARVGKPGDGLAPHYGYIDKSGKEVIPLEYDNGLACKEGIVFVQKERRGDWQGLDTNGVVAIRGAFKLCRGFAEGLAAIRAENGLWGFINRQGEWAIAPQYEKTRDFSEGLAAVMVDGKWGFLDRQGKLAIPPQYDFPEKAIRRVHGTLRFHGGLCRIPAGSKTGYIDQTGKWIWPPSE